MRGKWLPVLLIVVIIYAVFVTYLAKSNSDAFAREYRENLDLKAKSDEQKLPRNGTLAEQQSCSKQADEQSRKRNRVLPGTQILLKTVVGHFNAKLNRCLVMTRDTIKELPNGPVTWYVTVNDGFDNKNFAFQMTQRQSLDAKPETNKTTACTFELDHGLANCEDDPGKFQYAISWLMEGAN